MPWPGRRKALAQCEERAGMPVIQVTCVLANERNFLRFAALVPEAREHGEWGCLCGPNVRANPDRGGRRRKPGRRR